jgi:cyclomaltodextrinase
MPTPFWVQDSIFYQIFPDRFANGDRSNDPSNVQKWGSPPTIWGFQGGDLRGIIQHFDYILDLGITALYLTPIFLSSSTHRYNTCDYFQVDPRLGTLEDFRALIETAHRNQVRVILDGVFNHCGRGFFPFVDVLENGEHSAYKGWFYINRFPVDAYGSGDSQDYNSWWNFKALPKLNFGNPEVRRYVYNVERYWLEQGIDGWRLDVPNEIDNDSFWSEFRQNAKKINRDAYLVGEIWDVNPRWTDDGHFDGLMNYPVRDALLALLQGRENAVQFSDRINNLVKAYRRDNLFAMFVPLDSHDTERFKTLVDGNTQKLKLAYLFQMAFPGAPSIYYGDEIGLEGGKDPDSRRAFPWKETDWNQEMRNWVKTLIALRKRTACLRRGDFRQIYAEDGLYAFARILGEEKVLIALNASDRNRRLEIPGSSLGWADGRSVQNMLSFEKSGVASGKLTIPLAPWSGAWLS